MSDERAPTSLEDVKSLLKRSREDPTAPNFNEALQESARWLLTKSSTQHWFCPVDCPSEEEFSDLFEVSTFSLRLCEFKAKGFVIDWRSKLDWCLRSCCDCVLGYVKAKHVLIDRYLSLASKPSDQLPDRFRRVMLTKEAASLLDGLRDTSSPLSPASLQLVLLQPEHTVSTQLTEAVASREKLPHLPKSIAPPPGLLVWSTYRSDKLRQYALDQLQHLKQLSLEDLQDPLIPIDQALLYVLRALGLRLRNNLPIGEAYMSAAQSLSTSDQTVLWGSFLRFVGRLDRNLVLRGPGNEYQHQFEDDVGSRCPGIVRLVCSHLGDTGDHWISVLHTFIALLDKCGPELWGSEDPAYSGIVMHAILDNVNLERNMQAGRNVFGWIVPFIDSVKDSTLLQPHLSAILNILLIRLQLPRFELVARTTGARAALRLLLKVFVSDAKTSASERMSLIKADLLDVHSDFLSRLAFAPPYACVDARKRPASAVEQARMQDEHAAWSKISTEARRLLGELLAQDSKLVVEVQHRLAKSETPSFKLCRSAWTSSFAAVQSSRSSQAVSFAGAMLRAYAPQAHLDKPSDRVWLSDPSLDPKVKPIIRTLQSHFDACATPLSDLLSEVSDSNASKANFLKQDRVCQDVVAAMLSPLDDIHNAALTVVREAYDSTYTREQCFRRLLLHHPVATIDSLQKATTAFCQAAAELPDMCNGAMRMARCLSSVLEALCSTEDGLLRVDSWLNEFGVRTALPRLWNVFCDTSASIYENTPLWARFHENEKMTVWMRDAIIFGQSIADEVRSFEAASCGRALGDSPQRMSNVGTQLVTKMGRPVDALQSWLRLNDANLYRSTASLLVKFITRFVKASVPLSAATLKRIKKYASSSSSRTLDKAEIYKIVLILQRHPLHRDEFADIMADAEPQVLQSSKSRAIDIDEDDDDVVVLQSSSRPSVSKSSAVAPDKANLSSVSAPSESKKLTQTKLNKSAERAGAKPAASVADLLKKQPITSKPSSKDAKANPVKGGLLVKPSQPQRREPPPAPRQTFSHAALRKMQQSLESGESDSESEDEEEDAEAPKGLASIAHPFKRGKVEEPEKRQVKMMTQPVQSAPLFSSKDRRQVTADRRAENAARLRAPPDYSSLHRTLLQWDLSHQGQAPPHTPRPHARASQAFSSSRDYISHFEPLLMFEAWSQISQARDELAVNSSAEVPLSISGRQSMDDFTDVFTVIKISALPEKFFLTESDLVVLSQPAPERRLLAKVQEFKKKGDSTSLVLRIHFGADRHGHNSALLPRSQWQIARLTSLSTMHREWAALKSLPYLTLSEDIVKSRLVSSVDPEADEMQQIMRTFRANPPQASAILQASKAEGFSLIQGPPGTGKTTTILSLVGALCSQRQIQNDSRHVSSRTPARLLLCAPSNAAVDEIVRRLKDGIRDLEGTHFSPRVVRVGAESAVSSAVRDVFIDELVDQQLNNDTSNDTLAGRQVSDLRNELDSIKYARTSKQEEIDKMQETPQPDVARLKQLDEDLRNLRRQNQQASIKLQEARDNQQARSRALDVSRRNVRTDILTQADVICTTLSGSGHDYMSSLPDFDTVIIDEAAQSVELSCLIPLKYGCQRCIMVGDPQQLPPTVLSRVANNSGYDRSLFQRLQSTTPDAVHLLSIQYRMHPDISRFPSHTFYAGRLQDGPGMAQKTAAPWHRYSLFPTFAFLHVKDSHEQRDNLRSLYNRAEATAALALYTAIRGRIDAKFAAPSVGIVTAYAAQLRELKRQFKARFGTGIFGLVDFNTVDGFQGQEKDIIILSCVRGGPQDAGIGFLSDERRMNVALTRARSSLFVLANAYALEGNEKWGALISQAKAMHRFKEVMPSDFNNPAVASHSESSKAAAGVGIAAAYERPPPSAPATTIHSRMRAPTDTNGHQARRTLAETQTKAIGPSEAQCAPDEQDPPGKRRLEEAGDDFAGPSAATKRLKQQEKAPSERAATSGERPAAPSGSHSHLPAVSVTQRMVPAKQSAPPASSRSATVAPNGQVRRPPKAASSGLFVPKKKR